MKTETVTPQSEAALEQWPKFCEHIRARLEAGKRVYGDSSFEKPLPRMLTEIQEELMDVCGWSFILFQRIEALRRDL